MQIFSNAVDLPEVLFGFPKPPNPKLRLVSSSMTFLSLHKARMVATTAMIQ